MSEFGFFVQRVPFHEGGGVHTNVYVNVGGICNAIHPHHREICYPPQQLPPQGQVVYEQSVNMHPRNEYEREKATYNSLPPAVSDRMMRDGAELNLEEKKTHLNFERNEQGWVMADGQHWKNPFYKYELKQTLDKAAANGDGGFVNDLFGGPKTLIHFDGKNVIIMPPRSAAERAELDHDKVEFARNAEAIGQAMHGQYEKAREIYDAEHGTNRPVRAAIGHTNNATTDLPDRGGYYLEGQTPPAQTTQRPANQYQGQSNPPPAQTTNPGQPAPAVSGKPSPATPAVVVAPAETGTTVNVQVAGDERLINKLRVGEAQEILNKHFGKHVKFDGVDTLKRGGQGETDRELSKILGRQISDGMTQSDLNELEKKAGIDNKARAEMLSDVRTKLKLSGVMFNAEPVTTASVAEPQNGSRTATQNADITPHERAATIMNASIDKGIIHNPVDVENGANVSAQAGAKTQPRSVQI